MLLATPPAAARAASLDRLASSSSDAVAAAAAREGRRDGADENLKGDETADDLPMPMDAADRYAV